MGGNRVKSGYRFALGRQAFSLIEICIALVIIIAIFSTILIVFGKSRERAYTIIAKHDLKQFQHAQKVYYQKHFSYYGEVGDIISSDPILRSGKKLKYFNPSPMVIITIISEDPFVAQAKHKYSNVVFTCNVETGVITEKEDGK